MKTRWLLLATLVACASDDAIELPELVDGKGDLTEIDIPLVLAGNATETFALTADRAFEVSVSALDTRLHATAGTQVWSNQIEPKLVIDLAPGTAQRVEIVVTNLTTGEIRGRLRVRPAAPACEDPIYFAWLDSLEAQLNASGGVLDTAEQMHLEALIATRPCASTSDGAYLHWLTWYRRIFDATGGVIDTDEAMRLSVPSRARPEAVGDQAWDEWIVMWRQAFSGSGGVIDAEERVRLETIAAIRPRARGDAAYVSWAKDMSVLASSLGSALDADEKGRLDMMLSVKPCAMATSTTQTAMQQLSASMPGEIGSAYLALVGPAVCQQD